MGLLMACHRSSTTCPIQECDRLNDFQGVRDYLEYKSPGSSRTGSLAVALINSEQELAREQSRSISCFVSTSQKPAAAQ